MKNFLSYALPLLILGALVYFVANWIGRPYPETGVWVCALTYVIFMMASSKTTVPARREIFETIMTVAACLTALSILWFLGYHAYLVY